MCRSLSILHDVTSSVTWWLVYCNKTFYHPKFMRESREILVRFTYQWLSLRSGIIYLSNSPQAIASESVCKSGDVNAHFVKDSTSHTGQFTHLTTLSKRPCGWSNNHLQLLLFGSLYGHTRKGNYSLDCIGLCLFLILTNKRQTGQSAIIRLCWVLVYTNSAIHSWNQPVHWAIRVTFLAHGNNVYISLWFGLHKLMTAW